MEKLNKEDSQDFKPFPTLQFSNTPWPRPFQGDGATIAGQNFSLAPEVRGSIGMGIS